VIFLVSSGKKHISPLFSPLEKFGKIPQCPPIGKIPQCPPLKNKLPTPVLLTFFKSCRFTNIQILHEIASKNFLIYIKNSFQGYCLKCVLWLKHCVSACYFDSFTSSPLSAASISLSVVCELNNWKRKHSLHTRYSNIKNVLQKKHSKVSPLILYNGCHNAANFDQNTLLCTLSVLCLY